MPSFVEIGQPVLEKKIFERFLPYMGMALIGQSVSEEKIFENGGRRTTDGRTTDGRTDDGAWVYYKLTL